MAYNRRTSTQSRPSRSEEDAHLTSPTTAGLPPLSPPRPFFLARGTGERGSYSSADTVDTGSDSDSPGPGPAVASPTSPTSRGQAQVRQRNHKRRSQQGAQGYAAVEGEARDPFATPGEAWSPTALYEGGSADSHTQTGSQRGNASRAAPPSAFAYPYQAPGSADPSAAAPGMSRRSSVESIRRPTSAGAGEYAAYPPQSPVVGGNAAGYGALATGSPSATDLHRPIAPFMAGGEPSPSHSRRSSFHSDMYRGSAAGAMQTLEGNGIPRVSSTATFRAPFLSPSSRPGSSFWTPPQHMYDSSLGVSGSTAALGLSKRAPMPSSRLANKLTKEEKPWLKEKDTAGRISWWLTVGMMFVGLGVGAVIVWQGYTQTKVFHDPTCHKLHQDFRGASGLDTNIWAYDIELGGFGNGEFEAMTDDSRNLFFQGDGMHIRPTLVAEQDFGGDWNPIFDQGTIDLTSKCTTDNSTACSVNSNNQTILNPVYSARINTKASTSMKFGKVEVVAKLPKGDWLWPAIWMLPKDSVYGAWPLSGEMDIMEARGNAPDYPNGGNNVVRSTLNYGPLPTLIKSLFGWQEFKRTSLADGFHTYGLEWDHQFMRFYIDTQLHAMLEIDSYKQGFFKAGSFPPTFHNGSDASVVVDDPWTTNSAVNVPLAAPFDQEFYMVIDLAVGGTSGWFPDAIGNKPWYDNSGDKAMYDFAAAHDTWYKTWPQGSQVAQRDFVIRSVDMYQSTHDGQC